MHDRQFFQRFRHPDEDDAVDKGDSAESESNAEKDDAESTEAPNAERVAQTDVDGELVRKPCYYYDAAGIEVRFGIPPPGSRIAFAARDVHDLGRKAV